MWIYNLWTEQWAKYAHNVEVPWAFGLTCVVNGTDVYILGGYNPCNYMLLKLTINANGSFTQSIIHTYNPTKVPSPRLSHCTWEHRGKMWIFGGFGTSPDDYLNDHGDFILLSTSHGANNQLLYFDPPANTWTNAECFGDVPSPRGLASAAIVEDTVWLYGGVTKYDMYSSDFYELNMLSVTWTKIETSMSRPHGNHGAASTPVSASQLVLYGGDHDRCVDDQNRTVTWLFDVQSHTWRKHPTVASHRREKHTAITGVNSSVVIFGGTMSKISQHRRERTIIFVRLEPRCLQQLAIQVVYKFRSELPWKSLPKKLTCIIMDSE